jgi:dTDP-glucose pyrophosphorylase
MKHNSVPYLDDLLLDSTSKLSDAINVLNKGYRIALVINSSNLLQGIVTDGDLRRSLSDGIDLNKPISSFMQSKPTLVYDTDSQDLIASIFYKTKHHALPVINSAGEPVDILLKEREKLENIIFIMAGGKGTRLMPLTKNIPKPMLSIAGRPILEIIISKFIQERFQYFYISINYLADIIEDYFKDGASLGVEISYVKEKDFLGTAGSLAQLKKVENHLPVIVTNGDLLTTNDYSSFLAFHNSNQNDITVSVRHYSYNLAFGECIINNDQEIELVKEKPLKSSLVATGQYILNNNTIDLIDDNEYLDMPDFINRCIENNLKVGAYILHEDWLDIGQHDELDRADEFYAKNFL